MLPWGVVTPCNSSFKSPGVVQTDLALWVSAPMTLYLAHSLWWLSHFKYCSVWVGLWHIHILRELSVSGLTNVSRKGIAPFYWLLLTVNFILGSMLLMWFKKSCFWACSSMTQVSSTNLYQYLGGYEADLSASPSKPSMYRLATIRPTIDSMAALSKRECKA